MNTVARLPLTYTKISFPDSKPIKCLGDSRLLIGKLPGNKGRAIGVDPGVNYGITLILDEEVVVQWGKLPKQTEKGRYGIEAYQLAFSTSLGWGGWPAVVEGASYRSMFGQVGLEEIRFGFYFGLYRAELKVKIAPPATVRLKAFGSGKQQAADIWPTINHNGADSIGMALCALEMNNA